MYTTKEVADMIGTTTAAVRMQVHRGKIVPDARTGRGYLFSENTIKKFMTERHSEDGVPTAEICGRYGISDSTLRAAIKEFKIVPIGKNRNKKLWHPEDVQFLAARKKWRTVSG